jgi:hypothetical protein
MRPNEQVTFVRYGFFALTLFAGYDEVNRYDLSASARKYAELCRQRLQAEYPRAKVEVVFVEDDRIEGALPSPMRTQVLVDPGSEMISLPDEFKLFSAEKAELEDAEHSEYVERICEEVLQGYEWQVPRSWPRLENASKVFQVPIPALRWLCSDGYISEAERTSSGWEFPHESLTDFLKEHNGLLAFDSILSVIGLESEVVSFRSLPGEMLFATDWPMPGEVWIAPAAQLDGLPFSEEDWSVIVDSEGVALEHHFCAERWEESWTYLHYAQAMVSEARNYRVEASLVGTSQMTFKSVRLPGSPLTPHQSAQDLATELRLAQQNATIVLLGGPRWKPEYEKDEDSFCRDILEPLLCRMGYRNVRYTHGKKERGRDFVFSEMTCFNDFLYYAVQAKAGNVGGGVNSDIDEIVGQLDDGFTMDYAEPGCAPVYISVFVVAISGHFTENAEDQIRQKMPRKGIPVGAVYFWDKAKILSLIRQYWGNAH